MVDTRRPLKKLRKRRNQALSKYSEAIRGELSHLDRLKFKAIVVIEIHSRDVIEKMYRASKSSERLSDFQSSRLTLPPIPPRAPCNFSQRPSARPTLPQPFAAAHDPVPRGCRLPATNYGFYGI